MFRKWKSILIAAVLTFGFSTVAFGAEDLTVQSTKVDVESTVQIIRGMYNKTNSGGYGSKDNQWMRPLTDGGDVVKAVVSNGDATLDRVMKENGYSNYTIQYYYDNPDYSSQVVSGYDGPNFAFVVIDGKEYRYYFCGNSMIRRIGPDGAAVDNPKTNQFMDKIYKVGCRNQNDLSICSDSNLKEKVIVFASRYYEMGDHTELYARVMDGGTCGLYVVDSNTKIGSDIQNERTWRTGDNGYTWLNRYLRTDTADGGYASWLECFEVNTTGNHVDSINGIYATH